MAKTIANKIKDGRQLRNQYQRLIPATLLLTLLCLAPLTAAAGQTTRPPIHLYDNRAAGFQIADTVLVNALAPFVCPPYPACTGVNIGARVIAHPKIVNLFWDNDWDANNPSSPSKATVNGFVQLIAASDYLDQANQYGVFRGMFNSAHESSSLCQTVRPSGPTDFSSLLGWIDCEVQTPFTGVPFPDDDTVYAVFLPEGVTITGALSATCTSVLAFHAWSAAAVPDPQFVNPLAYKIEGFPYLIIPAQCMVDPADTAATLDRFTSLFAHELVEGTFDPFPPTGWIDNAHSDDIKVWTSTGEPADICQPSATPPDGMPTFPVRLSNGVSVETYWSNAANTCVPVGPVSPPDTTAPVITPTVTGTLGSNSWYISDVSISWNIVDPESPITSKTGCDPTTITADTTSMTDTCIAGSAGGLATKSVTFKRDATPPVISHVVNPAVNGSSGWYISAPTVTFSCSDALSGLASCFVDGQRSGSVTLGESASAQTVRGTATDNAGNVSPDSASGLRVDLSDPTISGQTDRPPNANGWWRAAVTVTFSCADAVSGVASCPGPVTLGEGAGQSVSGTTSDFAGRSASAKVSNINIDTTAPVVTYTGNTGSYTVDQTINITCAAADALSGIASTTCANITGAAWMFPLGITTRSASANDLAGNTGTGSTSFTVIVTPASLANLITQFLGNNGAAGLIAKANAIAAAPNGAAKAGALMAFDNQVDAKTGNPLTPDQAALLKQLAAAL